MARISIELTDDQHRRIKVFASFVGKSIKETVLGSVFGDIDKILNNDTLEAIDEVRSGSNLNTYKTVGDLFAKLNRKCL